jgi:hypothetical protein
MVMVCNIQNYWVSGLCPSSGILNSRKPNVSETSSSPHVRTEKDPASETLCFLVFRIADYGQSPEILSLLTVCALGLIPSLLIYSSGQTLNSL